MHYYIYFLTNINNTVLYIGRTENLVERIRQHKLKQADGFTRKYNVSKLVYYEIYQTPQDAAEREWKLKKWRRAWKNNLVNQENHGWNDLYNKLLQDIN